MKKQLLIILAVVFVAAAIISVFLIVQKNKKIAGATTATNPGPQYPKIEKYEVPILMYHYIRVASANDDLGQKLSVTPTNFNEQMKYLKDNGYVTIKLSDVADPEKKELSRIYFEKKKPIVLTFDDGYQDAYTQAFSILKKNDFKITVSQANSPYDGQIDVAERVGIIGELGGPAVYLRYKP